MPQAATPAPQLQIGVLTPLRQLPLFRLIWTANLISGLGTMMQGVGAAWLMIQLAGTPDLVALVQTATLAPILLFSLFAGALADILDRRRVLIFAQLWTVAVAAALALLGHLGLIGPLGLLAFTFALGIGTAMNGPAWQSAVREIVPPESLAAAVTLNAVAMNIARAIGPAMGGALVAAFGAESAFLVNAVSTLAMVGAMLRWRRVVVADDLPRERLGSAVVTGLRYVRETPAIRAVLVRGGVFGFLAAAVMALLPLLARDTLGGGALLYGTLLGAFGIGALGGAFIIQPLRQARGTEFLVLLLTTAFGAALIVMGLVPHLLATLPALALAGAAWLGSFSTFNITVQMATAPWVQARVLALYQATIFGGMAVGSWVWGQATAHLGVEPALVAAGTLLLLSLLLHFRLPLASGAAPDLSPLASRRQDPEPLVRFRYDEGPVLVLIEYRLPEAGAATFMAAMEEVGHLRKRDGAGQWTLYQDTADAQHWFETFTTSSWFDYLRQRRRGTAADEAILNRARALVDPAFTPVVRRIIHRETIAGDALNKAS